MHWHVNRGGGPNLNTKLDYLLRFDPAVESVGCEVNPNCTRGRDVLAEGLPSIEDGIRETAARRVERLMPHLCSLRAELTSFLLVPDEPPADFMYVLGCNLARDIASRTEPLPPLHPAWFTSDVVALARGIRAAGHSAGVPILTDALLEAGCDDALVIEHLRTCTDHGPCCWVADMICAQADAR